MTDPNDTAFPASKSDSDGLTKREYAAIVIAAGNMTQRLLFDAERAEMAVNMADALIAALNKEKERTEP